MKKALLLLALLGIAAVSQNYKVIILTANETSELKLAYEAYLLASAKWIQARVRFMESHKLQVSPEFSDDFGAAIIGKDYESAVPWGPGGSGMAIFSETKNQGR